VVTYETIVAIDKPEGLLKPDMTAKVEISLARRPDVLAVPSEAVKRVGEEEVVYILPTGEKKAVKRVVKTRFVAEANTEITTGIKPGETVILSGLESFGVSGFTTRR